MIEPKRVGVALLVFLGFILAQVLMDVVRYFG